MGHLLFQLQEVQLGHLGERRALVDRRVARRQRVAAARAAGGDAQDALDVAVVHARPVMAMPSPRRTHVLSLVPGAPAIAIHDWSFWGSWIERLLSAAGVWTGSSSCAASSMASASVLGKQPFGAAVQASLHKDSS